MRLGVRGAARGGGYILMGYDALTIGGVVGCLVLAGLWAFKDKLCPNVPEWCGIPAFLSPCWWVGRCCFGTAERGGGGSNTFPFDRRAAPLPPQQAQAYALQPTVATLAQGPALSTPQPIPVAVAVVAPPQHSGAPVAITSGGY